ATLDTTTRSLHLDGLDRSASLSDTVGFIRDLPHKLVEAFEATLQEANDAHLLLHVVDSANAQLDEQVSEVERVLEEIGASDIPQVLVYNKVDRLEDTQRPRVTRDFAELPSGVRVTRVFVSAVTGEGLDVLRQVMREAAEGEGDDTLKKVDVAAVKAELSSMLDEDSAEHEPSEPRSTGTYHSRA
ncbi:MAG: GTPase, partial [Caldimonas sp.]